VSKAKATPTWQEQAKVVCTQTERPILVGPFRQEFGFEVLYWIPFVRWARDTYHVKPERLVVATRGGAGVFYRVTTGVELYRLRTLKEIRVGNALDWMANASLKQREVTPFDRELIRGAEYDLRQEFALFPPALMFQAFNEVWGGRAPQQLLYEYMKLSKLPVPPLPETITLPEAPFTAVKLYSRATLPHTGHMHHWSRKLVRRLCERGPVVSLEPPDITDDHASFMLPDHPNLTRIREAITLDESLAIQGAVIGRAKQFVGTYGGMQQLALLQGIPSVGFYSKWEGTLPAHLECSQHIARSADQAFYVLKVGDEDRLKGVL